MSSAEQKAPQTIGDDFDEFPEKWVPITDLSAFCGDEINLDKTEWDCLDFSACRDEKWYAERYPGFPPEVIEILAHCDGTNMRPQHEKNEWEKRRSVEKELKEKLTIRWD